LGVSDTMYFFLGPCCLKTAVFTMARPGGEYDLMYIRGYK
jgi:hypothetical protein